jgi:hypothetical protein
MGALGDFGIGALKRKTPSLSVKFPSFSSVVVFVAIRNWSDV